MDPSDEDLVQAAVHAADARAFDALVRRHHGAVRSLLRRLCRDEALADDLAQETFAKAHARLDRYLGSGSFRAWLGGIAYREYLMALRKRRRETRKLDAAAREALIAPARAEAPDALIDLDRALSQLPENHREAVVLNFACGMSHAEVARAMGAPLGTIKTWIASAKDALRADLEDDDEATR